MNAPKRMDIEAGLLLGRAQLGYGRSPLCSSSHIPQNRANAGEVLLLRYGGDQYLGASNTRTSLVLRRLSEAS